MRVRVNARVFTISRGFGANGHRVLASHRIKHENFLSFCTRSLVLGGLSLVTRWILNEEVSDWSEPCLCVYLTRSFKALD